MVRRHPVGPPCSPPPRAWRARLANARAPRTRASEAQAKARGLEPDTEKIEAMRNATLKKFEEESSPYFATARLWDDGILDPRHTRQALAVALSVAHNVDFVSPGMSSQGVFRF